METETKETAEETETTEVKGSKGTKKIVLALIVAVLIVSIFIFKDQLSVLVLGYEELELKPAQIEILQDTSGKALVTIQVAFNGEVDIDKVRDKIFIAKDEEGNKISNNQKISSDSKKTKIEVSLDKAEKGDFYLFVEKGIKAGEKGFVPLKETAKIKFTVDSKERLEEMGFEGQETKSVHIELPYEWYMTQTDTGPHSDVNCGPTSVSMALKWGDNEFEKTPEDARESRVSQGGWWSTGDIIAYLMEHDVKSKNVSLMTMDNLVSELDAGQIAILCLDTSKLSINAKDEVQRTGLYYAPYSGHFIVAKGYKLIGDDIYLEVYDPFLGEIKDENGISRGRNRYYSGDEMIEATKDWYNQAIIILD